MGILSVNSPNNILVRDFIFQYSVVDIVVYLVNAAYFVLQTYYSGATLGKKMFQIRVVSTEERKMTLFEVIYRETIGRFLSGVVMNLGYLLILVDKEHRSIHDILSDTHVVYYHEKKVYVHAPVTYRNMNIQPNVPPAGPNMGQPNVPPMNQNMNQPGNTPSDRVVEDASPMGFVSGEQETPQVPFTKAGQDVAPDTVQENPTQEDNKKIDFSMPAGYFSMDEENAEMLVPESEIQKKEAAEENEEESEIQEKQKNDETME